MVRHTRDICHQSKPCPAPAAMSEPNLQRTRQIGNRESGNLELLRHDTVCTHIRPQLFGNNDAAVSLLVILQNCQPCSTNGQAASIQSVEELSLLAALGPPADVGTPRLIGFEV